jgi:hypothetical protein
MRILIEVKQDGQAHVEIESSDHLDQIQAIEATLKALDVILKKGT